jgi:serine/threonine protein kinase
MHSLNRVPGSDQYYPKLYGGGEFYLENNQSFSFIVMEKLGKSLQDLFSEGGKTFSIKTICQIGVKLLNSLKLLHEVGFIHNDIKLENVMVGDGYFTP